MADGVDTFIQSALFSRTFKEGMALVEETANYLDGDGREISKSMTRSAAMAYAGCSMRLTTQLMQIASWLLVLRAMREGDMTVAEASDPKYRLHQRDTVPNHRLENKHLPEALVELIHRADQLHDQISRLDAGLFIDADKRGQPTGAAAQQQALLSAYGAK